jgi:hypothetical protein
MVMGIHQTRQNHMIVGTMDSFKVVLTLHRIEVPHVDNSSITEYDGSIPYSRSSLITG